MKYNTLIVLLGFIVILLSSAGEKEAEYTVKFTPTDLQALEYCLDKSEAEHIIVMNLKSKIASQLATQNQAKPADTVKSKK